MYSSYSKNFRHFVETDFSLAPSRGIVSDLCPDILKILSTWQRTSDHVRKNFNLQVDEQSDYARIFMRMFSGEKSIRIKKIPDNILRTTTQPWSKIYFSVSKIFTQLNTLVQKGRPGLKGEDSSCCMQLTGCSRGKKITRFRTLSTYNIYNVPRNI